MFLKEKINLAIFPSWCNELTHISFTHSAMLLERKLALARFSSWYNVFDDNVAVLYGKLPYEN